MLLDTTPETTHAEMRQTTVWPWRIGMAVDSPELADALNDALVEQHAECRFCIPAGAPAFDVASVVEHEKPDLLFVELAAVSGVASEWIARIRQGGDLPLVVAVHKTAEAAEMIAAMRAGAGEFLSLPLRPAIFDAMDRAGASLESRHTAAVEKGRTIAVLSAKGGCGATTVACHLASALRGTAESGVLVTDLDYQAPAVHRTFRTPAAGGLSDAFDAVRRLNSASWPDFVNPVKAGVDVLTGLHGTAVSLPEPWRTENLFRFLSRQYGWILADLGRHLNPANWAFLQNADELFVVTAPDVLALYQTRSVLQMLAGRGYDKSRIRLILNRNQSGPQDFWIESIAQMFEMGVYAVLPDDSAVLNKLPRDRYEFPAASPFGRAVSKLAARMIKPPGAALKKTA